MKYFFTSVWCSLTIIFTAHCMQNPVNNGTLITTLLEQQYFIFYAPNYENKFGIIPSTLSSTDSLLRIFQTNEQNDAIVELLPLQEQNNQIATKVTSNNNTTIFIANNNFFAHRAQKNNIHNTITPLNPAQGLPSSAISIHNNLHTSVIVNDINQSNNKITHTIYEHEIDDIRNKRAIFGQTFDDPNQFPLINTTAVLTCHPFKKEIACKLFNNELTILSTDNNPNHELYSQRILVEEIQEMRGKTSYQLIKYSPQGKFIVFLYPNTLGIYNTETGKVSYLRPKSQSMDPAYHYISMAFYLQTNIIALLNRFGNIDYLNVETESLYPESNMYEQVQDIQPIRDNALIFSRNGRLAHATVSNHLVRYKVPASVTS